MTDCYLCGEPIDRPGQQRGIVTATGTDTIHQDCRIPETPVTRLKRAAPGDEATLTANDYHISGTIAGTGQTHTPAPGRYLFIEAREWDGLPTDRVMILHEYTGSWQPPHVYVDGEPFEAGGWVDVGAVVSLDINAADD